MESVRFAAWLIFNVAVPLLVPIALLPLLGMSRTQRSRPGRLIRRAVQDGQLFWTVIALCASACYEVAGYLRTVSGRPGHDSAEALAWFAICYFVVLIIGSSVLVLLGTMDAVNHARPDHQNALSAIMLTSVWLSALAASGFAIIHRWTSGFILLYLDEGGCYGKNRRVSFESRKSRLVNQDDSTLDHCLFCHPVRRTVDR